MNTRPAIFCTRRIPQEGIDILKRSADVRIFPLERQIRKDEMLAEMKDIDGLLCLLTDPVDAEVIGAGVKLKVISTYAVGYNNIDLERAASQGVLVTNTPGVLTEATADIAFALIISAARRIVESDAWLRKGSFRGWGPMLFRGQDLMGKTLGIIGAGRIGRSLAKRAAGGFDMSILYNNRKRNTDFERESGARWTDLDALLKQSDFISLHVPLTSETKHMIGEREFSLMKQTAVFVNTARGPVMDEQALIRALQKKQIFAAGLDVYEEEPQIPEELLQLPNAVLLPHIGSASVSTRRKMAVMAAENLLAVLDDREPQHRVI